MINVIAVILAFSFMILIHEFGHLISAKKFGIKVSEFALGFGPKIFSKTWHGTEYSLRCIPLGGFNDIEINPDKNEEGEFYSLPLWKRVVILAAGSVFNLLSAFVMIYLILVLYGTPVATNMVDKVVESTPAYGVLMSGDKILSVNGSEESVAAISNEISGSSVLDIKILRNNEEKSVRVEKEKTEKLGIVFLPKKEKVGVFEAIPGSCEIYKRMIYLFAKGIHMIFRGEINMTEAVAGPIGISKQLYMASEEMGLEGILMLSSLISINLGFMNLLPIPCLDGGHITLQSIESLFRKKFSPKQIELVQYAGLAVIGLLFLMGLYADILRLSSSS